MSNKIEIRGQGASASAWRTPYARVAMLALLSLLALTVSACGSASSGDSGSGSQQNTGKQVEAVTPEDVLSDKERTGAPEFREWTEPAPENYDPGTRELFVGTDTSTGAIPAVKPFNFGRDPGGPENKKLSLDIPKLGLQDVPVFDSISAENSSRVPSASPVQGTPGNRGRTLT